MAGRRWVLAALLGAALAAGGAWVWYEGQTNALPAGIVKSNGRIEATRIDIATRFGGRLAEVLVSEGQLVDSGQIIARMDATQIRARLREAEAIVRQAEHGLLEARALLAQRKTELVFAQKELERAEALQQRGVATGETVDLRQSQKGTADAAVLSAEAGVSRAEATIDATRSTVERLKADLEEYELTAPRAGRVQYRLAEPGEVLGAGARVVTLIDLTDVYMTIYLPTNDAGRLRYGADARIIFDAAPQYVVPAKVTFVASEAQFTPRYVETESEREKLTFRVQVTIPAALLEAHRDIVKTGVPGVAYVQVDPSTPWPDDLAVRLPDAG